MFSPYGVSGVVIIAESHLAIHTWPELGYAAVDLFTCGPKCDPKIAYEFLKKKFTAGVLTDIAQQIQELSGFESYEMEIENAKN